MKKTLLILLTISLIGCSSKKTENDFFEVVEYDCVIENDTINLTLEYTAKVELPYKKLLRDSIIAHSFGEINYKKSNKRVLKDHANTWLCDISKIEEFNTTPVEYKIDLYGNIIYQDSIYLSYLRSTQWEDNYFIKMQYKGTTFDIKTGKMLTEEDLFGADYKRKMHKLLVKYATPLRNDITLPREEDNLYNNEMIQPNGNFVLTDSSVMYIFHKYEIAYGYYGNIFIDIPRFEFENLSK